MGKVSGIEIEDLLAGLTLSLAHKEFKRQEQLEIYLRKQDIFLIHALHLSLNALQKPYKLSYQCWTKNTFLFKKNWRLNERHYGELEGIKRWSAVKKFGFWPVLGCQLKFNIPPPLLDFTDERYPGNQLRYSEIDKNEIPRGESLQQTYMRMQPYWEHIIAPELQNGKKVLIVSHKNVLRTLIMRLEGISNVQHTRIIRIQIATARPLVYSLNNNLHIIKKQYISNV